MFNEFKVLKNVVNRLFMFYTKKFLMNDTDKKIDDIYREMIRKKILNSI